MPTMRKMCAPICKVSPRWRPRTLDAATSSGLAGARPSETRGIPGPCSGAPNAVTFRVDEPSFMIVPTQPNGAAAVTPATALTRARSTSGKGVEPMNGPAAPSLTTNASTPNESTVFRASTRKPFASPLITSVIPKMSPVLTMAITRRRFRHCISRRAAKSIPRRYQRAQARDPVVSAPSLQAADGSLSRFFPRGLRLVSVDLPLRSIWQCAIGGGAPAG